MNQLCSLAGMATVKTDSAANQDQAPNQNPKWSTAAGSLSVFLLTDDMLCKMCPSVFYYLKHGGKKKKTHSTMHAVCVLLYWHRFNLWQVIHKIHSQLRLCVAHREYCQYKHKGGFCSFSWMKSLWKLWTQPPPDQGPYSQTFRESCQRAPNSDWNT